MIINAFNGTNDKNKQDKITAKGILQGDGEGNISAASETEVELVDLPQEVFWATYGTTTLSEILEVYNANKLVCCNYNGNIYQLNYIRDTYFMNYRVNNAGSSSLKIDYIGISESGWNNFNYTVVDSFIRPISLPTNSWVGSDPYTQSVTMTGVSSSYYKVDIQLDETKYDQLIADNVNYFCIKNTGGQLTAVAKGGKPEDDFVSSSKGTPSYQATQKSDDSKQYTISKYASATAPVGNRHIYALSVQDIIDYLSIEKLRIDNSRILNYKNVYNMFCGGIDTADTKGFWLRSPFASQYNDDDKMLFLSTGYGGIRFTNAALSVRPAFKIDLSKITFTVM